jgi:serine/threonine-protein kinase
MSPEQIRGQTVDTRSDVFAFGLVMYERATGVSPFQGATSMDVMSAILHKETSPPGSSPCDSDLARQRPELSINACSSPRRRSQDRSR